MTYFHCGFLLTVRIKGSTPTWQMALRMESGDSTDFVEIIPSPPTEKAIEEMAIYLGADPIEDRDLFYIAEKALTATLPPGWRHLRRADGVGDPFFFNAGTGESVWSDPGENYYKDLMADAKRKKGQPPSSVKDESEIAQLRKAREVEIAEMKEAFEKERAAAQAEHTKAMQELRQKHERELQEFPSESALELKTCRSEEIQNLNASHTACIQKLKSDHQVIIENLQKTQDEERLKIERELTEANNLKKKELICQFEEELRQLQQDHERRLEDVRQELDQLRETFEQEKQRIETDLRVESPELEPILEKEKLQLQAEFNRIRAIFEQEKQKLRNVTLQTRELLKAKRKETKRHEAELEELRHKHALEIAEERRVQLRQLEAVKLSADEQRRLLALKSSFEAQKRELLAQFESELSIIRRTHNNDRIRLEQDYRRQLTELRSAFESRKTEYEVAYKQLKSSNRERLRRLEQKHAQKVADQGDQLRALDDTFTEERKAIKTKHEKVLRRLAQQNAEEMRFAQTTVTKGSLRPMDQEIRLNCGHFHQLSIAPSFSSLKRRSLSLSYEISLSPPSRQLSSLAHTFACIASFAPSQTHSASINNELLRLSAERLKLRRMQEQFDMGLFDLGDMKRTFFEETKTLCQGYTELIDEQCWMIQRMAFNFQTDIARIAQNFRQTLSLGASFAMAESPPATIFPDDNYSRRRRKKHHPHDSDIEETEIERKIREWQRS
jgi:hypothetical protein